MDIFDDELDTFDLLTNPGEDFFEPDNSNNVTNSDAGAFLLEGLNPEQSKAVQHLNGPLLILAGAGSGKTRVITYRIAYMMKQHNVAPSSILAITFTNKAANEMKERITALVGDSSRFIWSGTFHSIFARILRRHAESLGYTDSFNIIDADDQLKLIKKAMVDLNISDKLYKPKNFQFEISKQKNEMIGPEEFASKVGQDPYSKNAALVYKHYQKYLIENNSMDFDDILMNMVKLLSNNPEVLEFYQQKFRYIMVDEYQDTNRAQYLAVKLLSQAHQNLCVVGDDDQSIYSFRGADVRMILSFEKDFKNAEVIKLEQNYRSTRTILDAANSVIKNNRNRKSKALRTEGSNGDKIILMNADTQTTEASFVADTIARLVGAKKMAYSDVAILYRMNALSRTVESALREKSIPFRVYGGMRFYDRKEIKDVFAYLRLIADSKDSLAFERIVNVPKRGIGDTTVETVMRLAAENGTDCLSVCANAMTYPELSRASGKLISFYTLIESFRDELDKNLMTFAQFIEYVENKSGIIDGIIAERESKGELIDRVENLKELLSEAVEFEKKRRNGNEDTAPSTDEIKAQGEVALLSELHQSEMNSDPYYAKENQQISSLHGLLSAYLENAALYTAGDEELEDDNFVKLMTIHSAKGLEFGTVFIIGAEEGVFPSYKCINTEQELEEERRLMYVAITRAKKNLMILLTRNRMLFGQTQCNMPSRFLREIPQELLFKMGTAREQPKTQIVPESNAHREAKKNIASAMSSSFIKNGASSSSNKPSSGGLGPNDFVVGMKVEHNRFGVGTVIKCEAVAGDALVTIDFDGMKKNMLAKSAGLKKA